MLIQCKDNSHMIPIQTHPKVRTDIVNTMLIRCNDNSHTMPIQTHPKVRTDIVNTMLIRCKDNSHTMPIQTHPKVRTDVVNTMQRQFTYDVHTNTFQSQCQYYLRTNLHDLLAMGWPLFPFFCALFSSSSLLTLDAPLFFSSIWILSCGSASYTNIFSTSHQTEIYHICC